MKTPSVKYSKKENKEDLTKKIEEANSKKEKIISNENKKAVVQEKKEKTKIILEIPKLIPDKLIKNLRPQEFSEGDWELKSPSKKIEVIPSKNLETSVINPPQKKKRNLEEEKDKYSPKKENKNEPKYISSIESSSVEYIKPTEISRMENNPWENKSPLKKREIGFIESPETKFGANLQQERYTPASIFEKENLQNKDLTKKKEIKYRPSAIS